MNTRHLFLLRHAKSSWDDTSLRDAERPLAPRGRRDIVLLEHDFRTSAVAVDLVLCSTAQRTRETWAGVRGGLSSNPEVRFVAEVYEATTDALLELVHGVDASVGSLMIIGHNPGIGQLAVGLAGSGNASAMTRLGEGFPTAGLAKLTVRAAWADLDWGDGHLDSYLRPRDLRA
jgi:phosphohistidine phosphatase